jgi:osmoprotectant transport system ATP-binding protein
MKMVNRLIEITSGDIRLDGRSVRSLDQTQLRRGIGYVIQQVGLFPHQTVAENVATVPRLLGWDRQRIRRRVDELLDLVGLEPPRFRDRYPNQLSGGQRQRVGVARALGVDPPVLLMDEPFGAIDPIARDRLQQEFLRLQGEVQKTVVFVTHDIDEAVRLGDRIAILRQGGVLEQYAPPAEVLGRPATPFVAEFVGADRGLKRLSVTAIDGAALDALPVLPPTTALGAARRALDDAGARWAAVVDDEGRLAGAVPRARAEGEGTVADRLQPVEQVPCAATLKDALAALLLRDDGWVAVVEDGHYRGALTPQAVHAAIRRSVDDGTRGVGDPPEG